MEYSFQSPIRIRNNGIAPASWWFVTVPEEISNNIKKAPTSTSCKWRWIVKVKAMIGYLTRETSIFPDKKSGCYLLPIKASIRKELHIQEHMNINISLTLI
jgi:hypothetical protein